MEPDAEDLLRVLRRWRDEAVKGGRPITRIAVAYEAGRDGFWLARWLESHGIETHVIRARASRRQRGRSWPAAFSRETATEVECARRRAPTDRPALQPVSVQPLDSMLSQQATEDEALNQKGGSTEKTS
jgi:transposase